MTKEDYRAWLEAQLLEIAEIKKILAKILEECP